MNGPQFPRTPKHLWLSVKVTEDQKVAIREMAVLGYSRNKIGRLLGIPAARARRWMMTDEERVAYDKRRLWRKLLWAKNNKDRVAESSKRYKKRKRVVLPGQLETYHYFNVRKWNEEHPERFKQYHREYEKKPVYKKAKSRWEGNNREYLVKYKAARHKFRMDNDPEYRQRRAEHNRRRRALITKVPSVS